MIIPRSRSWVEVVSQSSRSHEENVLFFSAVYARYDLRHDVYTVNRQRAALNVHAAEVVSATSSEGLSSYLLGRVAL